MTLALLGAPGVLYAQEGRWEGAIDVGGRKLGIIVELERSAEAWSGTISIPEQKLQRRALIAVSVEGDRARFEIEGIPGKPRFDGRVKDGVIEGSFRQGAAVLPFKLEKAKAPEDEARSRLAGFDAMCEKIRGEWKAPGVAIAIVSKDRVVYARGFGHRDLEGGKPVTAKTLFAIGSTSKAFTTFLLMSLSEEGKVDWDAPARRLIPELELEDPLASAALSARDMVTHRSGLPRHDLMWYGRPGMSRAEIIAALRHLEPSAGFRERFQYNNLMYAAAGVLAERAGGKSWESLVSERIFAPLGMKRSNFSVLESRRDADHALPYSVVKGGPKAVPFRRITAVGPAGSINSCVEDMAQWLRLQLSDGSLDGRRYLKAYDLNLMHIPQMAQGWPSQHPQISPSSYGLGWMIDGYRGRTRVHHGGAIDGFTAEVSLFPTEQLGIVVLTNATRSPVPVLLSQHAADALLGLEPIDWSRSARTQVAAAKAAAKAQQQKAQPRVSGTKTSRPLEAFVGDYRHPAYGAWSIRHEDGALRVRFNELDLSLKHVHYDIFELEGAELSAFLSGVRLSFVGDVDGVLSELRVKLEARVPAVVFGRLAGEELVAKPGKAEAKKATRLY